LLVTNKNSVPSHIPSSGRPAIFIVEEEWERLKVSAAEERMWFTWTKIEAPSSIGYDGVFQAFTVVLRPPMKSLRS
jgi:hypothetical protein